jgi:Nucleotide-diphospho-sugar transferase
MAEHFVTLFSSAFLVSGLSLYRSLERHSSSFCLWVLCMDEKVEARLRSFALPRLRAIPLREIETPALLAVKSERTLGEYCWTMTPFSITAVFDRDASAERVTYVDADVFFFGDPLALIREMQEAERDVLITEHAYDPQYDQSATSGRFCVQFVTFRRSPGGYRVCRWWQERCLEWCFDRHEAGRFGDQKYLDAWPEIFSGEVHVLKAVSEALAPWNARLLARDGRPPVLYHFHGLRYLSPSRISLHGGYRVGVGVLDLYNQYVRQLVAVQREFQLTRLEIPMVQRPTTLRKMLRRLHGRFRDRHAIVSLKGMTVEN